MFKLIKFLKNYKKETIIAPLFKLLESAFELIVPIITAYIIDKGIKNGDMTYVLKMSGLMLLMGVLGFTCALIAQYFAAVAGMGFGAEVRSALYKKINSFSYEGLDKTGSSTLITRLTEDVNVAQRSVNMFLRLFLRAPFIVLGAIIGTFIISYKIGLMTLGVTVVLAAAIVIVMKVTVPGNKKIQEKLDETTLLTKENIEGARVIRAFSKQKEEGERFTKSQKALLKIQITVGKISAFLNPFSFVCANLAIVLILWFGGRYVYNGELTQGMISALVNYMTQILFALVILMDLVIFISQGTAASERIKEILDLEGVTEEERKNALVNGKESEYKVEFKNVSFAYSEGGANVLTDISFTAKKGEVIGIIGGTGSGKTTLINLMPAFYDYTDGELLIDGVNVRDYDQRALREKFGIVPQKAVLFKGTIRDNLLWGNPAATEDEIDRALLLSCSKNFVQEHKDGIERAVEEGGKNLSGGQRQRLTIARALIKKPEILILDDSASALDYATEKALRKGLFSLKDSTVFIVSQRPASIMNADKIIVLEDGRAVGIGTHKDLYGSCSDYREICDAQFSEKEAKR